jgi:hypothetical protein
MSLCLGIVRLKDFQGLYKLCSKTVEELKERGRKRSLKYVEYLSLFGI